MTSAQLSEQLGGEAVGCPSLSVSGVNGIDEALASDVTFAVDASHLRRWLDSRAGCVIVPAKLELPQFDRQSRCAIRVPNVDLAVITVLEWFAPVEAPAEPGVHSSAVIADGVEIGSESSIGPHVTVESGSRIGQRVVLHPGVRVGRDVTIDDECILHANVSVRDRSRIGKRVILHSGVVIGTDGFGYRPSADRSHLLKVPHLGHVVLQDDVEIGANSCVDRGKFGATVIGAGTKIDNLVQIAHNCRVGKHCVIAGLAGLSGSVTLGDWVQLGGGVAVADQLTIGDGARVAARSGVMRDVAPGESAAGIPARPAREAFRDIAAVQKLDRWMREVNKALKALKALSAPRESSDGGD